MFTRFAVRLRVTCGKCILLVYNNDLVMLASTDMKYHWCKQVFNIIISNA